VVDDRLFISGPAVVIIIENNQSIRKHFDSCLMRIWMLIAQPEMEGSQVMEHTMAKSRDLPDRHPA
jgi:hypothetical protein